jgi:capsular exopolysaccharide synthesis family protein
MTDPLDRFPTNFVEAPDPGAGQAKRDNILAILRILWREKLILATGTAIGLVLAIAYLLQQVPIYEARTSVELLGVNEDFLDMRRVDPTAGRSGGDNYVQTQIKLLQSTALERSVFKILKSTTAADKSKVPVLAPLPAIRNLFGMGQQVEVTRGSALDMASETLRIRGSGLTRIIEVYSQSTWPKAASDFTNTLADQYIQQNLQARSKAAQATTEWLTQQLSDLRVKLEQSEQQLQRASHGQHLNITEQGNLAEAKLRQLQTDQTAAHADRLLRQSIFELTKKHSAEELPDVLNDPSLRDYRAKLTELRRQLADQSAGFTEEHPAVIRLKLQIETLESAQRRELNNVIGRIKAEYDSSARREELLNQAYQSQSQTVAEQAGKAIEYNVAKREVDTIRALYDAMLQKVREAGIAAALRRHDARVVDYADPPIRPIKPNSTIILGLGMFGGFGLCMMGVLIRERSHRAFDTPGDSADFLGVAELGIIPSAGADPAMVAKKRLLRRADKSEQRPLELVAWDQGPCLTSESFHAALVSINFACSSSQERRVLMVTSSDPSEGKTFTAVNLAVASAKRGDRVLLIDGDMRRPRCHNVFGVNRSPGLTTILGGTSLPSTETLKTYVQESSIRNLSILAAGDIENDIARLLHTPVMASLLDWAREQYDVILLDTPPMLQVSDARIFGRYVDAVVFAIRSGQTQRAKARAALRKFAQDGTVVLGTILTDWNPARSPDSRDFYHNYTSYYHTVQR